MTSIPHVIFDDFLPDAMHRGLVEHALAVEDFAVGNLRVGSSLGYAPALRQSFDSNDRLGPFGDVFTAAIRERFEEICAGLRIPPFKRAGLEATLIAYGDGGFFKRHRDVFTGKERLLTPGDRVITLVYYFHRQPRGFSGGELQIFPFADQPPLLVDPRDNRLIAFPSHLLHEVMPVVVHDRDFANSRFSISCWFNRVRPDATPS